jgi:DhnA family fructose-bisphosphate aldolase class Ia
MTHSALRHAEFGMPLGRNLWQKERDQQFGSVDQP